MTGCAGFIGSHLSEALIQNGNSVTGVDCFTDYYPRQTKLANLSVLRGQKNFKFIEADLSSSPLTKITSGVDAVFHLAAQPGVRASWGKTFSRYVTDNVVATQRLLEGCKSLKLKKFVYASSSSIYGDAERSPTPEDATPCPVSPYGATKLAGEHLCRIYFKNYQLPLVSLRFFTVYGPRQRPDMAFNKFISRIAAGEPIEVYGDGSQQRDFTYVKDIVAGNILALKAKPGAVYNVGAGKTSTLRDIISLMERELGKKAKVSFSAAALGDVKNTSADISKISKDLGYRASTGIAEGLKAQIAFQVGT